MSLEAHSTISRSWRRWLGPGVVGFFVLAIALLTVLASREESFIGAARHLAKTFGPSMLEKFGEEFVLNPWFYLVFLAVCLLEWRFPAREGDSSWGTRGSHFDLWYILIKLPVMGTLLPAYVAMLSAVFDRYFPFLTLKFVGEWPWIGKVVFALLLGDFFAWLSHLIRHKYYPMWVFHSVHHSQRQLNFFSEYRSHPFDELFAWTIYFVPYFMVKPGLATVVAIVWLRHWHSRFYHANIRTNMGWLRYVLVTPQSHRVHHSMQPEHFDKNFGLTFSIWDHLFGTQYRNYDEYPETGIDDDHFPHEQEHRGFGLLIRQLLYPFQALTRPPAKKAEGGA